MSEIPRRAIIARKMLLACGVVSLLSFFFLPTINAAAFYRVIGSAALQAPVEIEQDTIELYETPERTFLAAQRLPDLITANDGAIKFAPDPNEETISLTLIETFELGQAMTKLEGRNGLGNEPRVIGRFLMVLALATLLLALTAIALPWLLGIDSAMTLIAVGVSALILMATHLFTIGFDVMGPGVQSVFTWQSHLVLTILVMVTAVGSALPLNKENAVKTIFGTMAGFVVSIVLIGVIL